MRRVACALALIAALALAGIAPATAASGHRHRRGHRHGQPPSGVRGMVTAGPVCPVERIPPDPSCADRPITARLTLSRGGGGAGGAHGSSGADGTFEIRAAPGHYTLSATTQQAMRCTPQDVVVSAGAFTDVHVDCDTGIR
ncbi:MAG TPA: hypothetical protein VFA83_06360 [Acidimicrobiales bacterium]|nr:hypothetical protein [Acidimicrobiales bacterium]